MIVFKLSHYRILLWKQDELELVSPKRVSNVGHLPKYIEEIVVGSEVACDWDSFWQLYKPHKRAGQVILLTTADKIETMRESKAVAIRNLLVVYQGGAEVKVKEVIKSIPCIANISVESKGDNLDE